MSVLLQQHSQKQNDLRKRLDQLAWHQAALKKRSNRITRRIAQLDDQLAIADEVTEALEILGQELFEKVLRVLEDKLSAAIEEVLDQPVKFKSHAAFKNGAASVSFSVERDGNKEDVNRGQGGSVQNILSVGLRLFALNNLDHGEHRRFLVLDEQDCWLRPELVPRLVRIVHQAARELKFQVIMISHHDIGLFEKYADRIYQLAASDDGVNVSELGYGESRISTGDR